MGKLTEKDNLSQYQIYLQMGIDPNTKLPLKIMQSCGSKSDIKRLLRIIDEQDAVNRYKWYNLPCNITGEELERMIYYKGQLCFFYYEALDQFFFMPYALDGNIDFYGRYNTIHPIPFNGGKDDGVDKKQLKAQEELLSQLKLKCQYGILLEQELDYDTFTNSCVLLHDHTKQLPQAITPRQQLNDGIIDIEAECIPYMRTNLIASSGVKGMRVADADQQDDVFQANNQIISGALTGNVNVPIVGKVEFQELASQVGAKPAEFMLAMQSLDNFRLSTYGLENGGLFEKKQHILESENQINQSSVGLILQDGLSIRQNFCNIVNSIWGLNIWCEPTENETTDLNGDGVQYDVNGGEKSGVETGGADNGTNV